MFVKNIKISLALFLLVLFVLDSCAHKKEELSDEQAYNKAMEYFMETSYDYAAEQFEKIEDDFPFSEYAPKSQVMAAYAFYKAKSYEDSLRIIDYFTRMYPNDSNIEYMYYLQARNYYDRVHSYRKNFENTRMSKRTLRELTLRFPDSKYQDDALDKLNDTNDTLGASEMYIGRFYLKNKNYIGAIDKFKIVVLTPEYSKFHPEAYHRLVECYKIIGLENEAKKAYFILESKYPDTRWFKYSEKIMKTIDGEIND